ncbi:hypothetical protein HUJ05_003912 [Dendroctonus ponderosae]|nr:hypothetical protein HUJ05_003912 [Dendroctonus ponderosae]
MIKDYENKIGSTISSTEQSESKIKLGRTTKKNLDAQLSRLLSSAPSSPKLQTVTPEIQKTIDKCARRSKSCLEGSKVRCTITSERLAQLRKTVENAVKEHRIFSIKELHFVFGVQPINLHQQIAIFTPPSSAMKSGIPNVDTVSRSQVDSKLIKVKKISLPVPIKPVVFSLTFDEAKSSSKLRKRKERQESVSSTKQDRKVIR